MNPAPLVSVIMPAYNAAATIAESIQSVQAQTLRGWELLVIDDGSTDNTKEIVQQFSHSDDRIRCICQQNAGQGAARNKGIQYSNAAYIAFLDADDTWYDTKLEKQLSFIKSSAADLVFANAAFMDGRGKQRLHTYGVANAVYRGNEGLLSFIEENKAPLLTVFAKKDALLSAGGFSEADDMRYVEDYDLWLRMLHHGYVFAAGTEVLASYRLHGTAEPSRKRRSLQLVKILKQQQLHDPAMQQQKNTALVLWARRIIKILLPDVRRKDMAQIIPLLPQGNISILRFVNLVFGGRVTAYLALFFTKKIVTGD